MLHPPPLWTALNFSKWTDLKNFEELENLGLIAALGGRGRYLHALSTLSQLLHSYEGESYLATLVTRLNHAWAGMTTFEKQQLNKYLDLKAQPKHTSASILITPPLGLPRGLDRAREEGIKLHAFQRRALDFADRPRSILALEMGLGKTLIGIASIYRARSRGEIHAALIVAPCSAHESWEKHLESWGALTDEIHILTGWGAAKRLISYEKFYYGGVHWLVVSPQTFTRDLRYFERIADHHGDQIALVIDEAHKAKSKESNIGLAVERISQKVARVLALTGTPQPNTIDDLYYMVERVAPDTMGSYSEFSSRFTYREFDQWDSIKGTAYKAGPLRVDKLKELHEITKSVMLVISAQDRDVRLGLPPREDYAPYFALDDTQRRVLKYLRQFTAERELKTPAYDSALAGELGSWKLYAAEGATLNQSVLGVRVDQLAISPAIFSASFERDHPDYESPKLGYLLNIALTALNQGESLVVFCEYVKALKLFQSALNKRGIKQTALYIGDTSTKERRRLEAALNSGELRVLIAQTKALETGANLQAQASVVLHLNTPWSPDLLAQSTARVYRQGQKKRVRVYRPSGSRLEEAKNKALSRKLIQSAASTGLSSGGDQAIFKTSSDQRIRRAHRAIALKMGYSAQSLKILLNEDEKGR